MASLESKNTKLKTKSPNPKPRYQGKKNPKPILKHKLPNCPTPLYIDIFGQVSDSFLLKYQVLQLGNEMGPTKWPYLVPG